MLWDYLCDSEHPSPEARSQGMAWGATPLSPWDYDKSCVSEGCGLLPKLEMFVPVSNMLVDVGENKDESLKVIKTMPLLFSAEEEDPSQGREEPVHMGLLYGSSSPLE